MDFAKNPLFLLCIGFILGLVVTEIFYTTTSPLILPDGSVTVLTNRDYFPKASEVLSHATDSIHIVMFSANYQTSPEYEDSSVNKLLQQLVSAKNKGLDVRLIMDVWPEGNDKAQKYLEDNNILVKMMDFDGTTHAKLIIVDEKTVIVGSTNWSYHSIEKNNEANVIINNKEIGKRFEDYFNLLASS